MREQAVFLYELAAELERRSEELKARWAVTVEPGWSRIIIELADDDAEQASAERMLAEVMADYHLA